MIAVHSHVTLPSGGINWLIQYTCLISLFGENKSEELHPMDDKEIEFETSKTCYQEHSKSFRALDQHLWKIPAIAMTLTGGLWFAVANINMAGKEWLLFLAAISDFGLILVLFRIRFIMSRILEKLADFSAQWHVSATGPLLWQRPLLMVVVYSILLAVAGFISMFFFFELVDWHCKL